MSPKVTVEPGEKFGSRESNTTLMVKATTCEAKVFPYCVAVKLVE
jgi:hypothetical protein